MEDFEDHRMADSIAYEQLDALRAIIADISVELELSPLLQSILERSVHLLKASGGDLGLVDEDGSELTIVASYNMGKDYKGIRVSKGEGAIGQAVAMGRGVKVDHYSSWENASQKFIGEGWQSVLAMPFQIGTRIIGAIRVIDFNPERQFSQSDQRLLSLFAQHCAIVVENARLYAAARQAAERRAILHQVSQEIVTVSLDPEGIYQAIHAAAAQLMPAEAFAITQYDQITHINQAVYLIDRSGRTPNRVIPEGRGLSGRIIVSGESIYIEDTLDTEKLGDVVHFGDPDQVRSVIAVAMRLQGKVVGMLSAQCYRPKAYTRDDIELLEMLASYAAIALDNARLLIHAQHLAITDPLTDIFNRRHFFEIGERELRRALRFHHPLSVIMIDIDHFKDVNDCYGHAVGDDVLYRIAQLFKASIRDVDSLGRYGGEEFTIILPETDQIAARQIAERIRTALAEKFQVAPDCLSLITVSMGIATLSHELDDNSSTLDELLFADLVKLADNALYRAKNQGRNRIEMISSVR